MSKKTDTEYAIKNIQKKYDCKLSLYEKESNNNNNNNENKEKKDDIFSDSSNSENEASNKEKTTTENQNLVPKSVKVREIWIGNLPDTITKEILYKTFFIYGEISSIDIPLNIV